MNSELSFFEKNIYRIIFSVLLTVAFLFCAGSCVGIKCLSAWHFGVAFFIIVQISIFFTSSGKGHLISGLFMGILITCIIIATGKDTAVNFVVSYYKWILGKEGWQSAWILGYELINTIFVSCSCCLLEMLLERYKNLQIGFACLIIIVLLISMLLKVQVPHTGVASVLLYLVCVFVEWGQWNWKKHKNKAPPGFHDALINFDVVKMQQIAEIYKAKRKKKKGDALNSKHVVRGASAEQIHNLMIKK